MSAIRPMIFGLGMAAVAAFGTDYLLQRRARPETTVPRAQSPAPKGPAAQERVTPNSDAAPQAATNKTADDEKTAIAARLKVGERAIALPLRDGVGEELLGAGTYIDVLATVDVVTANGKRESSTMVVAERVQVLATHPAERTGKRGYLLLAVAAELANSIELAATKGTLGFTVRSPKDEALGGRAAATMQSMAGTQQEVAELTPNEQPDAAPSGSQWEIKVFRGSALSRELVNKQ